MTAKQIAEIVTQALPAATTPASGRKLFSDALDLFSI
jgi:hypothetical protein